jgi:hypothetical protein
VKDRAHEQLDIHEIERMVARALIEFVDDANERQRITAKRLAERTGLPLRRVREVTDAWNLQTLSGDELWLGPGSVERARACAYGSDAPHSISDSADE